MAHLEIFKLAVDMAITLCLVYIGFKVLRLPEAAKLSRRTLELEAMLKTLIREADDAGRSLNDQLRGRQSSLEKLLSEFEGAEKRLKTQIEESRKVQLAPPPVSQIVVPQQQVVPQQPQPMIAPVMQSVPQPAVTQMQQYSHVQAQQPASLQNSGVQQQLVTPQQMQPIIEQAENVAARLSVQSQRGGMAAQAQGMNELAGTGSDYLVPEPPSFESTVRKQAPLKVKSTIHKAVEALSPKQIDNQPRAAKQPRVNIYGEPVEEPSAPVLSQQKRSSLTDSIERDFTDEPSGRAAAQATSTTRVYPKEMGKAVDDLYQAAEQLFRAGKDLQSVAAQTKLPVDELRMLNQMIVREQIATASRLASQSRRGLDDGDRSASGGRQVIRDDPRLGALSATRQTDIG